MRSISFLLASSQQNLFDIYLLLYVQSGTPDDGWKGRLKHVVLFQNKNKFEKLVHLVGITIETIPVLKGEHLLLHSPTYANKTTNCKSIKKRRTSTTSEHDKHSICPKTGGNYFIQQISILA